MGIHSAPHPPLHLDPSGTVASTTTAQSYTKAPTHHSVFNSFLTEYNLQPYIGSLIALGVIVLNIEPIVDVKVMEPQITRNTFCTYTGAQSESDTTVFFVSGNPGLIGYYHPFLSLLAQNLVDGSQPQTQTETSSTTKKTSFQIYGCSLGGFDIPSDAEQKSGKDGKDGEHGAKEHLYDLEDQIRFVHRKLVDLMNMNSNYTADASGEPKSGSGSSTPAPKRKVILIGHSVGAYIAMEVLRRHREGIPEVETLSSVPEHGKNLADSSSSSSFDIIGGVMLFPTVKDIAHSPSGQKLTVSFMIQGDGSCC